MLLGELGHLWFGDNTNIKFLRIILLSSVALALTGCATTSNNVTIPWTKKDLEELYIKLDDPKRINDYDFNKGGSVAVTIGEKIGEKDGYVMGPLMFWYIKNGELRIYSDSKRDYEPVELINKAPDHLILKFGNGSPTKYIKVPSSN